MFPIHDDNPTAVVPYVSYTVLAICIGVFLFQILQPLPVQELMVYAYGIIPASLFGLVQLDPDIAQIPPPLTILTSMFLHGGFMHIIGNMLYLWVFGNNVEAAMGHVRYAIFYIVCGVAAVFAQALPDTSSQIPMIGASGAISGVLGAYLLLYPQARVLVLIPIFFIIKTIRIPAMFVLVIWFLMQLYSSIASASTDGGVAFGAHVGGFLAGMIFVALFKHEDIPLHIPFVHFNPFQRR